jgi:hypothetical protein
MDEAYAVWLINKNEIAKLPIAPIKRWKTIKAPKQREVC